MASLEKRKSGKGKITYRAKIRLKGHPSLSATFDRKTDANKWIQQTESEIRQGKYLKSSEATRKTLSEAIDRYVKNVLPRKPASYELQLQQLNWWNSEIGEFHLSEVTPPRVSECRDKLLGAVTNLGKPRTAATVNRYLAVLSHLFTVAKNEWGWVDVNPLEKIKRLREARGRDRFLSDKERKKLLEECKNSQSLFLYTIVVIALSTGMRKSEILNLRWADVDLDRHHITIHETKNGEKRGVPLGSHALECLFKLRPTPASKKSEYIFPGQKGQKPIDIRSPWETAVKNAGLTDFRFHDLRHSAASYLAMSGESPTVIAEILGHKTLQMVKRYAHLSQSYKHQAVSKMNDEIFR